MQEPELLRDRRKKKGNCCTERFSQPLCVSFEVTFAVDIQNVEIEEVTCGG